jgi:hypothetical protein
MAIPEFILRKLFVQGSFQTSAEGFSFALSNTFAPATLTGIGLEVDGQPVPPDRLTLQVGEPNHVLLPAMQADGLRYELPASSVAVLALET